jgi:predicted metal-dependent peptidase
VDAAVHHVERLFRPDQIKALYGGGGTDMGVGLERALADGHDLIVVLTDGYTPWPGSPPRARVVVGLFHEDEAPPLPPTWAKVVFIPVE